MLICVRTTINLPDALGKAARRRAAKEGRTFTSLIEEGLRMVLAEGGKTGKAEPLPLPTYGDPNGKFLIDILDRDALWEALDADRPR